MLELYRRHNSSKCSSTDTVLCVNKRRGCPIWIYGRKPNEAVQSAFQLVTDLR